MNSLGTQQISEDLARAEAHANLGLLFDQTGMQIEAESHYLHSIMCNPSYIQTYLNLGALGKAC